MNGFSVGAKEGFSVIRVTLISCRGDLERLPIIGEADRRALASIIAKSSDE